MGYSEIERNKRFVDGILGKYQRQLQPDYGKMLVYRKRRRPADKINIDNRLYKLVEQTLNNRILQYEQKYYHTVTSKDNRRFIRTVEQIYNQPGEKKQLIHLFQKLGVVTKDRRDWKETVKTVKRYEEELVVLKKKLSQQEETILRMKTEEKPQISTKYLTDAVMENIRREIRMERMRYGPD